jgi:uncharacterized membrane protein
MERFGDPVAVALAGTVAGVIAGLLMSMLMMWFSARSGYSVWHIPNLIAAMWLGEKAIVERFMGGTTVLGFATHVATSALMGVIFPFWTGNPQSYVFSVLLGIVYAVASYPIVGQFVMRWVDPQFLKQTDPLQMTLGHAFFGVVMGATYPWLLG